MATKKIHTSRKMRTLLWLAAAVCCIVMLVSAVYYKDNKICKGVRVEIVGDNLNYFVNKNDIYAVVKKYGGDTTVNSPIASINLKKIELDLEKIIWIHSAELFFDNNNILKISVKESLPIVRIFTTSGNSFYIDSVCKVLPVSSKFSPKLPVFTGFAGNGIVFTKSDSICINELKHISLIISKDNFLMAMIEEINILPENNYELIPKIGNQIILLGDAINVYSKLEKLKLFYKKVTPIVGWNKYSKINLQYENQIVVSIKGLAEVASDSIRTLQLMKYVAEKAAIKSADSSQIFAPDNVKKTEEKSIEQSAEREDEGADGNVNTIKKVKPKLQILKLDATKISSIKKPLALPVKQSTAANIIKKEMKPAVSKAPVAKLKPIVKPNTVLKKPVVKPLLKPKK